MKRDRPLTALIRRTPFVPLAFVLLAAAVALLLALRTPPARTLDVSAPNAARFLSGFLPPEIDKAEGVTFRWTTPQALLRLHGTESTPVLLALRMHSNEPQENERRLRLQYGDQLLMSFALAPGWRTYQVLLPAAAGNIGSETGLTLASEPLRGDATNSVAYGVPISWVRISPVRSNVPPWRALVLTWGLAVLAGWLWRLDVALFGPGRRLRQLRICVPIAAIAAGLVWWASSDPYTLAWALPALPTSLGIATALLLIPWVGGIRRSIRPSTRVALIAAVMLVAAQALLNAQAAIGLGVALALLALVLLPPAEDRPAADQAAEGNLSAAWPSGRAEALLLALIFLSALGLRLYRIADLPYGLWRDEGSHGLVALQILANPAYRPAYIPEIELPGLGLYPFALALRLWGVHIWSIRTVTALAGALTVFPLYALTRRLYGRGVVPLGAAALLAVSSWHLTISRFSFPTIFDPLLQLTGLWLLAVGLEGASRRAVRVAALVLAGGCLGLALQTYHTGRLGPLMAAALGLCLLFHAPQRWRWWLAGVAAVTLGFVLAAAPLLGYALSQPDQFNRRTDAVFVLSEQALHSRAPLAVLDAALARNMLMFNVHGDDNGRHHAPGRPMLDFISGLGLLAGLATLLWRWRDWRNRFVLAALFLGMLPSILSVDSPHGMRSIDALPFACIIAALGLAQLWRVVSRLRAGKDDTRRAPRAALPLGAAALTFALVLVLNYWTYFVAMPANEAVWRSFYPTHTQIGVFLRELANHDGAQAVSRMYVSNELASNPVVAYLTAGLPVQTYKAGSAATPAPPGALFIMSGYIYQKEAGALVDAQQLDATPVQFGVKLPDNTTPSFVVFRKK